MRNAFATFVWNDKKERLKNIYVIIIRKSSRRKGLSKFCSRVAKSFSMWGRNARVLILTEPLWSISMSWVFFYRPIFLRESIKLSEIQIGLLFTVATLFSTVSPLAGGYLADRFGRKKVFMLFDSLGWLSSLAVWAITRNIWLALAAYVLEGVATVIYSVWECLLVEDTNPEHRASIYGYVSAIYNVGALSTPVAGYLVGSYGVDLGCRILFVFAFISLMPMFVIRQLYLRETEIGHQIMKERSFAGLKGYLSSLSMIKGNRTIAALLVISVIGNFYYAATSYLPLYLIDERGLDLSEEVASLIPAVSSISALVIASTIVPKLTSRNDYVKALASGYGLGCLAILLLSFSPKGSLPSALVAGVILGVYSATAFSVSRTFLTNEIEAADNRARAKILSITVTLSALLNLPTPTLAGYLFSLEPKLPFIAVSSALLISLATLLLAVKKEE